MSNCLAVVWQNRLIVAARFAICNLKQTSFVFLLLMMVFGSHFSAETVHAEIYKCIDPSGRMIFSDAPCPHGSNTSQIYQEKKPQSSSQKGTSLSEKSRNKAEKPAKGRGIAIVRLAKGGEVELETKSMKSSRGMSWHQGNNLVLPNGIQVPYKKVKKLVVLPGASRERIRLKIEMRNGSKSTETIKAPIPYISGESKLGRFNKQLYQIEQIDFN